MKHFAMSEWATKTNQTSNFWAESMRTRQNGRELMAIGSYVDLCWQQAKTIKRPSIFIRRRTIWKDWLRFAGLLIRRVISFCLQIVLLCSRKIKNTDTPNKSFWNLVIWKAWWLFTLKCRNGSKPFYWGSRIASFWKWPKFPTLTFCWKMIAMKRLLEHSERSTVLT